MYTLEELEQQNRDIANLCQVLLVLVQEPELRGNPYVCDLVSRFYDKVWMHLKRMLKQFVAVGEPGLLTPM